MDEELVLTTYESIARVTGRMLAAAQAGRWEQLTDLEREASGLLAPLVEHDRPQPASPEYQRRKAELIRNILADDARIRTLVEPRLQELSDLLGSTRREQRLASTYESDG